MQKNAGKKKEKCKNCEGKGTLKKGGPLTLARTNPPALDLAKPVSAQA
jgi:hypothetical protein